MVPYTTDEEITTYTKRKFKVVDRAVEDIGITVSL